MPVSIPPRNRFEALDTLRCLAVLFMVQGHTFTHVIEDGVRAERWYGWHNYLHGFTAPAFLFGAGLAFGVTTLHQMAPHLSWGATTRRRLYRYLSLLAIGYALQLPPLGAASMPHHQLARFARVEALQHIGAALLFCQSLVWLLRSRARVVAATAALGSLIVLLGPWLSRQPIEQTLPMGLAAYLTSNVGSTFPLLPWVGFVLFGVALGGLLPRKAMFTPSPLLALGLPLAGAAMVLSSLWLDHALPGAFGEHRYWKVNPYFFLRRLGWLLVLIGALSTLDVLLQRYSNATAPPSIFRRYARLISQSSLVIYVAHLLLLYGSPLNHGLRDYSHALALWQGALVAAALLISVIVFAQLWGRLERGWAQPFLRLRQLAVAGLAALVLFACAAGVRTPKTAAAAASPDSKPPPRLLLSVVIDQFGSDSLLRFEPLLPEDGLLRFLLERGRVYERAVYPYAATFTAPGHAALYSGATPALSGITTNFVIDRRTGKLRALVDDRVHRVFGDDGAYASPAALRVETVADALKRQSGGRAKVVSLSLKDRAAILPAGQTPDLVLWFNSKAKRFTTSSYYAQEPPQWVSRYQDEHPIEAGFATWDVEEPARLQRVLGPDDAEGEGDYKGSGHTFPHAVAEAQEPYAVWELSPGSTEYLLALAWEAVNELELGVDEVPDLLAISLSGLDYDGHVFGPQSWEYVDHLRKADRALMKLVRRLQAQTRLSALVTSDHGVAPLPERAPVQRADAAELLARQTGVEVADGSAGASEAAEASARDGEPAAEPTEPKGAQEPQPEATEAEAADDPATGDSISAHPRTGSPMRIASRELTEELERVVALSVGEGTWIAGYASPYVYLSDEALAHPQAAAIRAAVVRALRAHPGIANAYDVQDRGALRESDPTERAVLQSIHPATAGDIFVLLDRYCVVEAGLSPGHGTNHGSLQDYDTNVPVLLLEPGIAAQRHREPTDVRRVASTLAQLLDIEPPPSATLQPL